ncbi:CI-B8 domain-containing protein [Poronia punctata]|nr:CI-B8 domain-containing protein [Poronia punctata]
MVNPGKRMHLLQSLLQLRHGPGAAILPPEITRIHLDFAKRWNDGHLGPRKFWRTCLPRLKYWNPAIPMLVNRSDNQEGPATMSIYFRNASSTDTGPSGSSAILRNTLPLAQQPHSSINNEHPAPPPGEDERVVTIDMKNVHSEAILDQFIAKTGATPVQPTPTEQAEMRQIDERTERAGYDRVIMKKFMDDKRHEERMLAQAKQEAAAIRAANQ